MRTLLSRLTYANVTATIALALGLTGGAYATVSSGAPHTISADDRFDEHHFAGRREHSRRECGL